MVGLADTPLPKEDRPEEDVAAVGEDIQDSGQVAVDTLGEHIAVADIRGRPQSAGHSHRLAVGLAVAKLVVARRMAPEAAEVAVDILEAADSAL